MFADLFRIGQSAEHQVAYLQMQSRNQINAVAGSAIPDQRIVITNEVSAEIRNWMRYITNLLKVSKRFNVDMQKKRRDFGIN